MNRYLPLVPTLGIITLTILAPQLVLALERSQIAAQAEEITVRIEGEETTGTGTIIEQDGDRYTVLTCWHVANAEGTFEITTVDGEVYQATEVKNLDNDIDLAILQFTSTTPYEVAVLGDSTAIAAGTSSYVVGYPDPIPGIPERAYIFQNADIVSKLTTGENGYQIVHSNPTTGGSSGGGIFDNDGRLIGINGKTTSDAEGRAYYGLAIPLEIYLAAQGNFTTPGDITPPQDLAVIGRRKLNLKDYQGAITDFNLALASNPNDLDALSGRGEAYYWLRDFGAAINDFDAVLQRNPNNASLFFKRGYAYGELKESEKAIADYSEAIRLNPEDADAYYNRGKNYSDLGEYDRAIADYNEAIRLDPEDTDAYNNRGISYKNLREYDRAIADYNEAIRLDPEDTDAYNNRGISYKNLREYDRAIADYDEAIRLDPEDTDAYYNRGISYNDLREYDRAIADYDEAIRLDPEDTDAFYNRGNSYKNLGEYEKAIADYSEAIRLDPENANAFYNRGISYDDLGDRERATDSFQQAADLYQQQGNSEWYEKALDRLDDLR